MTLPVTSGGDDIAAADFAEPGHVALSRLSHALHWITAGLIAGMFGSGVMMTQMGGGAAADALYTAHKTTGAALLGLVLFRLAHRLMRQLAGRWPKKVGTHPIHVLLYGFLIVVPLLGWAGVSDFGARGLAFGLQLPAIWPEGAGYSNRLFFAHAAGAFLMLALVLGHIGLALGDYIQRGQRD